MNDPIRRPHLVIAGPSQWGQWAAARFLHRVVGHGGRISLIVSRWAEERFSTTPADPLVKEFAGYPSLRAALDGLKAQGQPIDYFFDDQLGFLAAQLIEQRYSGRYLCVGYVTSGVEEHFAHARFLTSCCERVLVEKPVSKFAGDVQKGGRFEQLAALCEELGCTLLVAEHYLHRAGVRRTLNSRRLEEFIERHQACALRYEFCFEEGAGRDNPLERLGAYQDGSVLDLLASHGPGPLTRLVLPGLGWSTEDLESVDTQFADERLDAIRALDPRTGRPLLPVLAETGARVTAVLRNPRTGRELRVDMRTAKGASANRRFFRLICLNEGCVVHTHFAAIPEDERADNEQRPFIGVSLGSAGGTLFDQPERQDGRPRMTYEPVEGGYRSDETGTDGDSEQAQAAMLDVLLGPGYSTSSRQFIPVSIATAITRWGLRLQRETFGLRDSKRGVGWGAPIEWPDDALHPLPSARRGEPPPGVQGIVDALGLGSAAAADFDHLVSVLGLEGSGRTETSAQLAMQLREDRVHVIELHVPRAAAWKDGTDVAAERLVQEQVVRQLATELGLHLRGDRPPAGVLLGLLEDPRILNGEPRVVIVNGLERLHPEERSPVIRVLDALPAATRVVLFVDRAGLAAGRVLRIDEVRDPAVMEDRPALPFAVGDPKAVTALWERARPIAANTLELRRLLFRYAIFRAGGRPERLQDELAAVALAPTLSPDPIRQGVWVASALLGAMSPERQRLLADLARVPGRLSRNVLEARDPRLGDWLDRILAKRAEPVRDPADVEPQDSAELLTAFDWIDPRGVGLPSSIRRALLEGDPASWEAARAEVEARRLLLASARPAVGRDTPWTGPDRRFSDDPAIVLRLLLGMRMDELDLTTGPFAELVHGQLQGLDLGVTPAGNEAALGLLHRLQGSGPTSLSVAHYAVVFGLYGRVLHEAATDWADGGKGLRWLKAAWFVARHLVLLRDLAAEGPLAGWEGVAPSTGPSLDVEDLATVALARWRMARVSQGGCWRMLLVGEDSPREDDDAWRVPKGTDAAPRPGHPPAVVRGAETWKSLRESGSPGPSSPPRTAAIQLRASALEDVVNRARAAHRDGKPLPREAAQDACSRCLEAAGRNLDADAKGCAARNLLEAGFFCRSAEVDTESAVDARPDRMVEELRGFFEALAPEGIELDVETRRARLDGLDESARSELKVRLRRVGLHHFADMLESTIR